MSLWHDMSWVPALRDPALTLLFEGFTLAGYPLFYLALLPLVPWLWKPRDSHRLVAFLIASALLNSLLKDTFDDPRPDAAFALDGRVGDSYGFPSGHAQLAVVTWGYLAVMARAAWARIGAAVMIVGIALSRLYLGVHDIEDVVGGLVLGGASLALMVRWQEGLAARWQALGPLSQAALILLPLGLAAVAWPEPDGPGGVLALGAYLFGWWLGERLLPQHAPWGGVDAGRRRAMIAGALLALGGLFYGLGQISGLLVSLGLGESIAFLLQTGLMGLYVTALGGGISRLNGGA
ncbi:MAG: hypothetical protein RLZZ174_443, partial [Pseudomonadota bacterium]